MTRSVYTLSALWLVVAAFVLFAVTFDQLRGALSPIPMTMTGADAFRVCVQMSQDRAKVTHRHIEEYSPASIIHTAPVPTRGVWYLVEYKADGRTYQCDLGCGYSGRCFMNTLYVR